MMPDMTDEDKSTSELQSELVALRERLSQLGCNLEVESSRKHGTKAAMTVSLNQEKDTAG